MKNAIENALGDIFTEVKTDTTTDDAADSHEKDKLTPELSTPIQQVKIHQTLQTDQLPNWK